MKRTLLLLLVVTSKLLIAQIDTTVELPNEYRYILDAPYIFEASVVRNEKEGLYHNDHVRATCLKIHKVFRGDLKEGLVQLTGHSENVIVSHGGKNLNLPHGYTAIFFCKKSNFPLPPNEINQSDNVVKLNMVETVAYHLYENRDYPEALFNTMLYTTHQIDDLTTIQSWYDFLKNRPGFNYQDYTNKTFKRVSNSSLE